jgi:hypothetical protein
VLAVPSGTVPNVRDVGVAVAVVVATPVPVRAVETGLVAIVKVRVPLVTPIDVGAKSTLSVHVVIVFEEIVSPAQSPPTTLNSGLLDVTFVMVTAFPVFVKVTVWLALVSPTPIDPKVRDGVTVTPEEPYPWRAADSLWGTPPAVPFTVRVPLAGPTVVGVKVTVTWQSAVEAIVRPKQVSLVMAKGAPVTVDAVAVSTTVVGPRLVNVTVSLVTDPTGVVPKEATFGLTVSWPSGAAPATSGTAIAPTLAATPRHSARADNVVKPLRNLDASTSFLIIRGPLACFIGLSAELRIQAR